MQLGNKAIIKIISGTICLERLEIPRFDSVSKVLIDGNAVDFDTDGNAIVFSRTEITDCIEIRY